MVKVKETREELLELIKTLSDNRKNQVISQVQVDKLIDKKRVQELVMKRLEAGHINDVESSRDQNNKPLLTNEWSKRAAVEERLALDEKFTKALKQYRLILKGITRATIRLSNLEIAITEMESREKILLTV